MKNDEKQKLSVYFNSACPICNAGIGTQKKRSTACSIQWKDVHKDNSLVCELKQKLITVRKYLHVSDASGQQHVGINAFIILWQNSPKELWKARLFCLPLIRQLSQLIYFAFANGLYSWNKLLKRW